MQNHVEHQLCLAPWFQMPLASFSKPKTLRQTSPKACEKQLQRNHMLHQVYFTNWIQWRISRLPVHHMQKHYSCCFFQQFRRPRFLQKSVRVHICSLSNRTQFSIKKNTEKEANCCLPTHTVISQFLPPKRLQHSLIRTPNLIKTNTKLKLRQNHLFCICTWGPGGHPGFPPQDLVSGSFV